MTQSDAYIMRCKDCGTKNRIPAGRVGAVAKCGKCGNAVPTDVLRLDHPVTITDNNFQDMVYRSPLPVMLECWAPWCGPCQMMEPFIKELSATWQGRAVVGKMNVDENPRMSAQYQVRSVPTVLIFDRGNLKTTLPGAFPKHHLVKAMTPHLYS